MFFTKRLKEALEQKRIEQSLRVRTICQSSTSQQTCRMVVDDKEYLSFGSNDYLGLSKHPSIQDYFVEGLAKYGVGSGASAYVTGFSEAHSQLEEDLASWQGYDQAILFDSGFSANQALVFALMQKDDVIIADKLMHASFQEAANLSPAKFVRYLHENIDQLQLRLQQSSHGARLVATEGIFSMDGDTADVVRINQLCQDYGAWLMVDEAHSVGVLGQEGRGLCAKLNIKPHIKVITFGKAFGLSGAAILCDQFVADYFRQITRHLIYSTSMPPAQAYALQEALRIIRQGDGLREKLAANVDYFKKNIQSLSCSAKLLASNSPIQPIVLEDNNAVLQAALQLKEQGLWVGAIRPPTVPKKEARLRITLSAAHEFSDIDVLLAGLKNV